MLLIPCGVSSAQAGGDQPARSRELVARAHGEPAQLIRPASDLRTDAGDGQASTVTVLTNPFAVTFAVVTNPAVPVTGLTFDDLREVFFFRQRFWSGGKRVVLLLPGGGLDARSFVLEDIYRLNDAGLKRLILERLFQGQIEAAPPVVDSYREALTFVAASRGTLAVVRADAIAAGQSGIKVLRINGKLPGEPGYPLTH
ncbi:MAG: hypothetical protein M3373_12770 [Gemmatimonadota bacterium]|nr:hypothetical protein [Gemmatimonadota bacterium]